MFNRNLLVFGLFLSSSQTLLAQGRQSILSTPFHSRSQELKLVKTLDEGGALENEAPKHLVNAGLNARFQLKKKFQTGLNLYSGQSIETVSYGFALDNVPVCDLEVKVHRTLDGKTTVMGDMPGATDRVFAASDWASDAAIRKITSETLLMASMGTDYSVVEQSKCLYNHEDGLIPAYRLVIKVGSLDYVIIADDKEVYRFDPNHFEATGSATVYATNVNEGSPVQIPLREMDSSGLLDNTYFGICIPSAAGKVICNSSQGTPVQPFAQETNNTYNYDMTADLNKFIQASVFTHANVHLQWLQSQGYSNFGTTQIKLLAHAKINGDVNNALYQPGSGGTPPMILVADGDGEILKNLGTDADVVSHELGHHVVYHTVTQIQGESLVIHEALADFFTFARTGNACLGESICTDSSIGLKVCAKPKQCLRSAENDLAYTDPDLPEQAHLRGQFISGLLWDLYEKDNVPLEDVTQLVLKAIDLLVSNSGYQHLVVGLMLADHAEYGDKYCDSILARAKTRGLSAQMSGITCANIQASSISPAAGSAATFGQASDASTTTVAATSSRSSKKGCGVIAGLQGSGQSAGLLLILSMPFAMIWMRRKDS